MKKFLTSVLLFLLPIVIIFIAIEVGIRNVPNEYNTKIENFKRKVNDTEILILGSSHALRAINPHLFDKGKAYSMAMVSQGIQMDHDILFKYKDRMPALKTIVLTISHFSLSKRLDEGEISKRLPFYHFFYGLKYDELKPTEFQYYSLQAAIGFRQSLVTVVDYAVRRNRKVYCDELGWMSSANDRNLDPAKFVVVAKQVAERHEDGSFDFTANLQLLQEILSWARSNNVQVLLVNTPKTSYYTEVLDSKKTKLINAELRRLENEFKNVQYLNYEDHSGFNIEDFTNPDHLNEKGAQKLTKLLSTKIK